MYVQEERMDIETIHYESIGLTAHVREASDGSFYVVITNFESSDAVYESFGWSSVANAVEEANIIATSPLPITF
jgi:hypothetical protein